MRSQRKDVPGNMEIASVPGRLLNPAGSILHGRFVSWVYLELELRIKKRNVANYFHNKIQNVVTSIIKRNCLYLTQNDVLFML